MIYKYDYTKAIVPPLHERIDPFQKLEPEIIPQENIFGIADKTETQELIAVLKKNFINRINICFPLNLNDTKLIEVTFEAIQNMLEE